MLAQTLILPLESALNAWLRLDPTALPQLRALQGKVIKLHITGLDMAIFFIPTATHLQLSLDYAAEPDVVIRGSSFALSRLARSTDASKSFLENGIQIEGDIALGQAFSQILRNVDIDWEELLSKAVGDIVAHQAGQLARQTQGWLSDTAHTLRMNTSEYLQEEVRLLPSEIELQHYLTQVDELRLDVERAEARLQRLEQKKPS